MNEDQPWYTEEALDKAAEALQKRWPTLGIVARSVVLWHPSKRMIAQEVLDAITVVKHDN